MLKRLLNECVLTVALIATGRLMVKEPAEETEARHKGKSKDEHQVAQPVRTRRPDGSSSLYLPGASLKGVLRAQAERIARSLNRHGAGACDPFTVLPRDGGSPAPDLACSVRINAREAEQQRLQRSEGEAQELSVPQRYGDVCPICRTFGHLGWGRRLRITDFFPGQAPGAVEMTHIGVDRVGGGVSTEYLGRNKDGSGRTFTVEYAYKARFEGQIILENFELWQLGLLGFLWRDLAEGLLPLGHKQTTGTGELQPHLDEMRLTRLGVTPPAAGELRGVGALFAGAERYGYEAGAEVLAWPDLHWARAANDIRWEARLDEAAAERLWAELGARTARVLRDHRWPERMGPDRIAGLTAKEVSS